MSFNVNFLGGIPYNPDNLHLPSGIRTNTLGQSRVLYPERMLGYGFNEMFKNYWTVKSYKITLGAQVVDGRDLLSEFIAAGGTSAGILGAIGGLAVIQSQPPVGGFNTIGYTKIYSKYDKKVRKSREGIIGGQTQFDGFGATALDSDPEITPNILESHIYRPNEGTLCSAGPVHVFTYSAQGRGLAGNYAQVILDFSDIKYYAVNNSPPRLYWPKIKIFISLPNVGAVFGTQLNSSQYVNSPYSFVLGRTTFNLNVQGVSKNLVRINDFSTSYISSVMATTHIANINLDIRPGDRCCDRFFWDGQDEERNKSSEVPEYVGPLNDEPCKQVCGDDDINISEGFETGGVFAKQSEKRREDQSSSL